MGVLSVMCEHNIITQVWEFSKIRTDPTVEMCGRVKLRECARVLSDFKHTRTIMQALIQLLPGCNLAHWGVNVSHGATLSHTEMGPRA